MDISKGSLAKVKDAANMLSIIYADSNEGAVRLQMGLVTKIKNPNVYGLGSGNYMEALFVCSGLLTHKEFKYLITHQEEFMPQESNDNNDDTEPTPGSNNDPTT